MVATPALCAKDRENKSYSNHLVKYYHLRYWLVREQYARRTRYTTGGGGGTLIVHLTGCAAQQGVLLR